MPLKPGYYKMPMKKKDMAKMPMKSIFPKKPAKSSPKPKK